MPSLVSRGVSKCQQVALFHVTLGGIWRGSAGNVEETFVVGQTATFESGFLGASFVGSSRPPGWLSNGTEKTGISCWERRWQLLSSSPREGKCEQSERWICGGRENVSIYGNLVLKENAWEINATRDWGGFLPRSSGPSREALKARLWFYIMSQSQINICKPILENLRINGPEMEHFCCLTAGVLIIPGSTIHLTIVSFHFIFLCAHTWHLTSS